MTESPHAWESFRLDEIAEVRLGRQRSPKNHAGADMRPYLRAANIGWSGLLLDDVKEMNFTPEEMPIYRLQPEDILLSEASGSPDEVGKPAMWSGQIEECAFQNTLLRVRSRGPEPQYLLYFLRHLAISGAFARRSRGVGIHHIGRAALASWPVPVPSLAEQRRIVEILEDHLSRLDFADRLVKEGRLKGSVLLRSLLLQAAVGCGLGSSHVDVPNLQGVDWGGPREPLVQLPNEWRWQKWREVGTSQNGRAFPSSDYQADGVRLLRPGNLGMDGFLEWRSSATRALPERYLDSHSDLLIHPGDVVMNLTAQSLKDDFLGRVCLVRDDDAALLNQRLARLVPKAVSSEFATIVFRSPIFRTYVSSLNKGSLIQHMFTKQIAEFWFPIPPAADEARVLARFDERAGAWGRLANELEPVPARTQGTRRALLAPLLQ